MHLIPTPWDKLAHALVFAVLAIAIGAASGRQGRAMLVLAVGAALLVGVVDEWHQVFLPGRSAGWDDLAADGAGGILGAALLWFKQRSAD